MDFPRIMSLIMWISLPIIVVVGFLLWKKGINILEPFTTAVWKAGYKVNIKKRIIDVNGVQIKYTSYIYSHEALRHKLEAGGYITFWRGFKRNGKGEAGGMGWSGENTIHGNHSPTDLIVVVYARKGDEAQLSIVADILKNLPPPKYQGMSLKK